MMFGAEVPQPHHEWSSNECRNRIRYNKSGRGDTHCTAHEKGRGAEVKQVSCNQNGKKRALIQVVAHLFQPLRRKELAEYPFSKQRHP